MTSDLVLVDVQNALSEQSEQPPSSVLLAQWANLAYQSVAKTPTEVTIRLVDELEMAELNEAYRGKKGTTNVLSFPFESDFELDVEMTEGSEAVPDLLGDIVICHNVIQREAREQNKSETHHYAHMVTHGVLHLCGYDHLDDGEAQEMEALEVKVLAQSLIQNPYT